MPRLYRTNFFELFGNKKEKNAEGIYKKSKKWDNIENFEGGK